jgi:hypothetical protein
MNFGVFGAGVFSAKHFLNKFHVIAFFSPADIPSKCKAVASIVLYPELQFSAN